MFLYKHIKLIFLTFFLILTTGLIVPPVWAVLDFSITPVDGGTTVRFSRGDLTAEVTKDVRVRITSTDNVQYQVYQQLVTPFSNERGTVIDRPVLSASIRPGSTGAGTAYLSSYEPIGRGEQLLYTSNPNGLSESFTLVYQVNGKYLTDSGSFNGLIQYTLRPVSGGQRKTISSNFFIESNAELSANVEGSAASHLVRLDSHENSRPADIHFSFNGNLGNTLRVYQEVLTYPINDLNSQLDSGILKLVTEGALAGDLSYQNAVEFPRNRVLIYQSTQQSDSFSVIFTLNQDMLAKTMAGNYRGVLRYSFETDREVKTFDIDLDIKISPLFEITLNFPNGPINFNKIIPGGDPQINDVDVEIKTNLNRPYVVKQRVGEVLINEKGKAIPEKYFTFRQDLYENSKGKAVNRDFVPVEQGETNIYYSDAIGSPTQFKVYYRLSPFPGMQAGDYKTSIVYDLGEL